MNFLKYGLALSFLALLTNCSGEGRRTAQVASTDISDYAGASCHFRFDEGEAAVRLPDSDVTVTNFGKKFDRNLLLPLLRASAAEVVRFAQENGVRFYKSADPISVGACPFAATLPEAPADLKAEFAVVGGSGATTGLYLPLHSPNLASTNELAAIVVRADTNKWVLVHEFMHHLFEMQRKADGVRSLNLEDSFTSNYDEYKLAFAAARVASGPVRIEKIKDAVAKLKSFNEAALLLLQTNALEEMTIESYLAHLLDQNQLAFVHKQQRLNSAMYIMSSAKEPSTMLSQLTNLNANFAKEFDDDLDALYESRVELIHLADPLETYSAELASLTSEERSYMTSQGFTETKANAGIVGTALGLGNAVFPCGQTKNLEEPIAKIRTLLEQL
jgi:hypothetical protein